MMRLSVNLFLCFVVSLFLCLLLCLFGCLVEWLVGSCLLVWVSPYGYSSSLHIILLFECRALKGNQTKNRTQLAVHGVPLNKSKHIIIIRNIHTRNKHD